MTDTSKRICGAKNRAGNPCQLAPMKGRNRCKLHGGATPRGTRGNRTHGLYTKNLTDEEKVAFDEMQLDSVDHTLKMANIILLRAIKKHLELTADEPVSALELEERRILDESGSTSILRRPDTLGIIDRYMGRVGSLTRIRAELIAAAAERGDGADDKARDLLDVVKAMTATEDDEADG